MSEAVTPDGQGHAGRVRRQGSAPSSRAVLLAIAVAIAGPAAGPAAAAEPAASAWVDGHKVRTRLLAGNEPRNHAQPILAGVEMDLADGWKTYWRNPGDAGGVPPGFDWSRSVNVASVLVRYPAPSRMIDKAGTTIGYKGDVVFPVLVTAKDAAQPVLLKLDFSFGTCREICVPGEAAHELELAPGAGGPPAPEAVREALRRVPEPSRLGATADGERPVLERADVQLDGARPGIRLHAIFPAGAEHADAFAEGPEGEFVPTPRLSSEGEGGVRVYDIDLTEGADIAALRGKTMLVTLVSSVGSSEVPVPIR